MHADVDLEDCWAKTLTLGPLDAMLKGLWHALSL